MLTRGVKKYITNPVLGLLPFVLFVILHNLTLETYALSISIIVSVIGEIFLRKYFNSRIQGVTFYITVVALLLTSLLWAFGGALILADTTYVLFAEMMIIIQFMAWRLSKTYILGKLYRDKSFLEKALANDFFFTATLVQYILTTHVFVVLIYKQITIGYLYPTFDFVLYYITPCVIIIGLGIYQVFKTSIIVNKLRREEWLPIVTERGDVTGRIAKAISLKMKNKFLHPVVRVALICDGKLYLQERPLTNILSPGKLDYPFEKYMLFKHEVNLAAHNSIKRMIGHDVNMDLNFVFKYVFENDETKRLVFLYTVVIDDESKIRRTDKMTGKFWSIKQIDDEFGDEIFSECFELEYEYLKHMILLCDGDELLALSKA